MYMSLEYMSIGKSSSEKFS